MVEFSLGLDLGGTKSAAAVVEITTRRVAGWSEAATPAEAGPSAVLDTLAEVARAACKEAGINIEATTAIGVGLPGTIDVEAGVCHFSPNLSGWHNVAVSTELTKRLGRPVVIDNDVRMAAWGERWWQTSPPENMIFLAFGTGIGSGIFCGGRLLRGQGFAGEVGHTIIFAGGRPCHCGSRGCWEAYASGRALAERTAEKLASGTDSLLRKLLTGGRQLTAGDVIAAARKGDSVATQVVLETAYFIGLGLANLINLFHPDLIVLGGGLMQSADIFLPTALATAALHSLPPGWRGVRIAMTQLGTRAGAIGAALYAYERLKEGQAAG